MARAGLVLGVVSAAGLVAFIVVSVARVSRILRLPYERWLLFHRFIGLLVLVAVVHGWALDPVIRGSALLQVLYVALGAVAATTQETCALWTSPDEPG